jgi:hypothetical protein
MNYFDVKKESTFFQMSKRRVPQPPPPGPGLNNIDPKRRIKLKINSLCEKLV